MVVLGFKMGEQVLLIQGAEELVHMAAAGILAELVVLDMLL